MAKKDEPQIASQPGINEPQIASMPGTGGPQVSSMPGVNTKQFKGKDAPIPGTPSPFESEQRSELAEQTLKKTLKDPASYINKTIPGAKQTSKDIKVKGQEILDPTAKKFQVDEKVKTGDTAIGKPDKDVKVADVDVEDYKAALVGKGVSSKAAQSDLDAAVADAVVAGVNPNELVSYQMEQLTKGIEDGEIPTWAQPAVDAVEAQLAARGLSRSSVGAAALSNAIIQAAMPMAQANAQTYFARKEANLNRRQQTSLQNAQAKLQLESQNLSNRQQTSILNAQQKQQALLSDQAAKNAARQFNASSENQMNSFMANLQATVDMTNAQRTDAMTQFNTGQKNAMKQFNEAQSFARQQFNAQNSTAIAQSNVQWRRQVNQINTAGQNAVNQANAMNAFNLSNQALTFMWQEMRDAAKWSFEAAENDEQRRIALAVAAMGNEAATNNATKNSIAALGAAAMNLYAKLQK